MDAKRMILAAVLSAASFGRADDPIRLIYVGADKGSWTGENVWSNAVTDAKVSWQDGAIAVLPGTSLEIPTDVTAHGLEVTSLPGTLDLTGAGKLTLGAGGVVVSSGTAEWRNLRFRNDGGLHLAADQTWQVAFSGMAEVGKGGASCPLTAAPDVTWKVDGSAQLRGSAQGRLTPDVTVVLGGSVQLSLSDNTTCGLGRPKLVLDGSRVRTSIGNGSDAALLGGNFASAISLRSGAKLTFSSDKQTYFEVPELKVEGDGEAKLSRFTGGTVRLAPGETVVDVADGHTLLLDAVLTNSSASTTLVKRGAGALTVMKSKAPVDIRVEAGTLQFASQGYKHYRFKIDSVYNPKAWGVQISEFKLLNGETAITGGSASFDGSTKVLPAGTSDGTRVDCWESETPAKAADDNLYTKWLDQRAAAARIAKEGDKVWVQLNYDEPVQITGYSWATANDAGPVSEGDQSCRDPSAWRLLASNDGENWVELDRREEMGPYADRRAWVGTFEVGSGLSAESKLGHIVVEAGGTLDLRSFTAATLASGSIENRGGTVLTAAGAMTASAVSVLGGTLSRGSATFGGKFFRVTITDNNGTGNQSRDNTRQTSIGEFTLYAADGSRITAGQPFKAKSTGVAADLAVGEVMLCGSGWNLADDYPITHILDGNAETWFFIRGQTLSADCPIQLAFRLPDDAARVAGYTLTTGSDTAPSWFTEWYKRKDPSAWKVEGSFDGQTWQVLDEVEVGTTPRAPGTEYNGGVPYAVTSWDDPAAGEEAAFDADAAVSVAPGATLDLRSEKMAVGHLAVDCRTGATGGTITRLTPMSNGTLDLTVDDQKAVRNGFVVPLTIGTVADAQNFATWSVRVNGILKRNRRLVYDDGKLQIHGLGFAVIIR